METQLKPNIGNKDNIQGKSKAFITLVEYGDYQCPYCGNAHSIVKKIQEKVGDHLRFVFRHFPLQNRHPLAMQAAVASQAAARQNFFWEMHDIIFENQEKLQESSFKEFAAQIGLNMQQFENDINDSNILNKVNTDFESGIISGVNGTPTFFINGIRYNGSFQFPDLLEAVNLLIQNNPN